MGTRGAYGFRVEGKDKVTYNHFDSYPRELGDNVLNYICKTPLAKMREIALRIELVDRDSQPSEEAKRIYRKYADLQVSEHSYDDWYCLLRNTQGDLFPYSKDLHDMIDSHEFLADSLFCEWAYIINLDTTRLEAYAGFNKNPSAKGRYASQSIEDNNGYYGVALLKEMPIQNITRERIASLVKEIEALGGYAQRYSHDYRSD